MFSLPRNRRPLPRVKTPVKDLPLPSGLYVASHRFLPHSGTSGRVGGGNGALSLSGQGVSGTGPPSGTAGEAPWPLLGHRRWRRSPRLEWKRCNLGALRAGDHGGDRGGGGAGAGKRTKSSSPPGRATPGPESYCPPYLRLSWTLVPSAGRRGSCPSDRGYLFIPGGGRQAGARAQEGAGRPFPRVSFKGSPALPFPPSSPSPQSYLHFKSAL